MFLYRRIQHVGLLKAFYTSDLFIQTPTRLLWKASGHTAITVQRLFIHSFIYSTTVVHLVFVTFNCAVQFYYIKWFCSSNAVSSLLERSKHFTLHPLADMFILTPTRLLWKASSRTAIYTTYSFIQLSELRKRRDLQNGLNFEMAVEEIHTRPKLSR